MPNFDISKRFLILLIVFVAGLFVFWGFRIAEILYEMQGGYPRELSVDGQGIAYIKPDLATVSVGVSTEGKTSEAVSKENNEKMNAVMAALEKLGVEEKDIQTTNYFLGPKYNWNEEQGNFQDGFRMEQNLDVRVRDFDLVNQVVQGVTDAGANVVGGVRFSVENPESAKTEARKEAVAAAKEKAKSIAEATGFKLKKLVNYYEWTDGTVMRTAVSSYGMGGEEAFIEPKADIAPGEDKVTINVTLTYRID